GARTGTGTGTLTGLRPDVLRARAKQIPRLTLLDRMRDPAREAPAREDRERRALAEPERERERDEADVDRRLLPREDLHHIGDREHGAHALRLPADARCDLEEPRAARIALGI